MTKVRVLTISVISLFLINLVLIGGILIGGPKPFNGPKMRIIDTLEFDSGQVIEFEKLISIHKNSILENENEIKTLKDELYYTLVTDDTVKQVEILEKIQIVKNRIELLHLSHFKDIKALCKPEQQKNYSKLVKELPRLFMPPNHHHKKP